ncbi:MAG: cytochrome P450 [Alphaproteobacteria bacterium]|nr:cytochrome P450 [Alphaproteobacteria bacterium]
MTTGSSGERKTRAGVGFDRCPRGEGGERLDGGRRITDYATAREVLRGRGVRQAGFRAELLERIRGRSRMAVLFQEGEAHRKQRIATARFFAPRVVDTRHRELMTTLSEGLVARLRREGRALLDTMSLDLAVAVAAEIIGLTESDGAQMSMRLDRLLSQNYTRTGRWATALRLLKVQWWMWRFYRRDVLPAIRARRAAPREDVISHLLAEGYANRAILRECLMYGTAGMATTREFIVMAGWHLLEREDLRRRFLDADEAGRIAVLEEILRLEPVVGTLYRRAEDDVALNAAGRSMAIPSGALIEIDVRAVNADPVVAGACPHRLDPDRVGAPKVPASGISFGEGHHRCPGAAVALQESAIFLDKLLREPGLQLSTPPTVAWNPIISSYELRGAMLTVGQASPAPTRAPG